MARRRYSSGQSAPRVRIRPNGRATCAGLYYNDLREILTQAALYNYDCLKKADDGTDEARYASACLRRIEAYEAAVMKAIEATFPAPGPLTREQRWQRVTDERSERVLLDELLEAP